MKLALDAGHGFNTAGKRTPDDIREWTMNNRVVTEMQRLFKGYNIDVKRIDDPTGKTDISLNERDRLNSGCDVLLSVHHNAYQSKWGTHTGTETLIQKDTGANRNYATAMNNAIVNALGLRNRGVKVSNTQIMRNFKGKASCLVEVGFMDSSIDHPIITKEDNSKKVAKALVDAFVKYWGISKKESVKPTPPPVVNGWVNEDGVFTLSTNVYERNNPSTNDPIGRKLINKGSVVFYSAYLKKDGYVWLKLKNGKVMPWREIDGTKYGKVELLKDYKPVNDIVVGSKVKIKQGSFYQGSAKGKPVSAYAYSKAWKVLEIKDNIAKLDNINSWLAIKDLVKVN